MNVEDSNGFAEPSGPAQKEPSNTGYESLKSAQPIAIATLKRALKTGSTREQLDAAKTILNRTGLPEKTQVESTGTGPPIPTQTLQNVLISINQIFSEASPGGSPQKVDFSSLASQVQSDSQPGTLVQNQKTIAQTSEDGPQPKAEPKPKITLGTSEKQPEQGPEKDLGNTLKPIPSEFFTKADSDSEDYEED